MANRLVDDAVAVKKTVKKMVKKARDDADDEDYDHRPRDSMIALERERRRLEEEEEERRRREREREQQLALEKRRIEEKMEQLRREEEERKRLREEEEGRRHIAAEKLVAEQDEQRLRRQWEQQEEELARRDGYIVNTMCHDNQIDGEKTKQAKDQRPSTRRSTLSLRDMLDMVVQDALPSDSDDSDSEELDTEDEKKLIRQIAKLKMEMKKKKKETRQRLRDAEDLRKSKTKVVYVYEDDDAAERRHKAKSFNNDLYAHSPVAKHCKSQGDVLDRNSGTIKALVPGEFDRIAAKKNKKDKKKNKNNNAQNDGLSLGQVVQTATSVATLAVGMDDEISADVIPDAVDAVQNLMPIGRFLGRKLHEATAKVAQMNEKETPSYDFKRMEASGDSM